MEARNEVSKRAGFWIVLMTTLMVCCVAVIHSGCEGGKMDGSERQVGTQRITNEEWGKVAQAKIYFGHRSVGKNIINGIVDLMAEGETARVNIVETTDAAKFDRGIFGHSGVGKNSEPETKIRAFEEVLGNGVGSKVDIAMLKFCFVDVKQNTDVNALFASYKESMTRMGEQFPGVRFVHFTMPLAQLRTSAKTRIKKALGFKEIWEFDNLARKNEYNELIRNEYGDTGAVFDLATVEATRPDGTRETFEWKGKQYQALVPDYTDDGGHLNEVGRKVVAAEMVRFLGKQN